MPFDFTPQFTHGPLSDNFSNNQIIGALNNEYNNNAAEWEPLLPSAYKPSKDPTGYWTAALTLGTWMRQNEVGCNGPGCSANNPYAVPFTNAQKQNFLAGLGNSCDPDDMFRAYEQQARWSPAVSNTYFNLGKGSKSFTWENGCLCISDVYNFEGIGDFGVGASTIDDPKTLIGWVNWLTKAIVIQGIIGVFYATPVAWVRGLLSNLKYDLSDSSNTFTRYMRGDEPIGNTANLYLKNCFCPNDVDENGDPLLCSSNNALYRCAIRSGKITYDPASACFNGNPCVQVGTAQPSPILGFPSYAPNVMEITTDEGSLSFGGSSGYPAPFTSFTQQLVNSNNYLGAYAMFGGVPGRLIIIPSGAYQGELGFTCQSWYNFNDGPHAKDANGNLYPTKTAWWNTCLKSEMNVRFLPLSSRPLVKVMVATKSFSDNTSSEVFSADYPIVAAPVASIALTAILAALPAATLTLI